MSDLSTVGGLIALIAVVPLSILLPPSISFENGIITSISTSKETIKNNNVVTRSYYRHNIEVEA